MAFLAWSPLGGLADAKELAEKHPASVTDSAAAADLTLTSEQINNLDRD